MGPRKSSCGVRRIVLPMFTWDKERISKRLSEICPSIEDQIDPTVPAPILRLLAGNKSNSLITFDEDDAIARLQPQTQAEFFPWANEAEWQKTLGNPLVTKKYLDIVYEVVQKGFPQTGQEVVQNVYLPDVSSTARPLTEMFSAINLPKNLGRRASAPILHPGLRDHRLFKKRGWKLRSFTLDRYLDAEQIETASLEDRRSFWRWLRNNWKIVKPRTLRRIADLPVWPSDSGGLLPLDALCKPHTFRVASILGDTLHRPSPEIMKVGLVKKTGKGRLAVRRVPTTKEISEFLSARLHGFPRDRSLTSEERGRFHEFELDLKSLAAASELRKSLTELSDTYGVALAGDRTLKPPASLVRSEGLSRLYLLARHIIDRPSKELDGIQGWKPSPRPTSAQIVDTLREDGERLDAHVPRLQEYIKQAKREDIQPDGLRDTPCIPVEGELYSPGQLALYRSRGFWGDWKIALPLAGINAEVQRLYKDVGVVGGEPTPIDSRHFFEWLALQNPDAIARHIDQILRHIGSKYGPRAWTDEYPSLPFIPVESGREGFRLVAKRGSKAVIPDFPSLEDRIREYQGKWPVALAVVSSPRVERPITSELRELGLRTLRDVAGEAERVVGRGEPTTRSDFKRSLDSLGKSRELRKRLEGIDLDTREVRMRNNWRERLSHVWEIRSADSISATFKIQRRQWSVPVPYGFDRESRTLWLGSDTDLEEVFLQAVADRIFESPKKFLGLVLGGALRQEVRERDPFEQVTESQPPDYDVEEDEPDSQSGRPEGPSATAGGHPVPKSEPTKNIPKPGPIPTVHGGKQGGPKTHGTSSPRPQSPNERAQIEDLKEKQYAWHCQACLSVTASEVLAPSLSYVALHQNRREVMQAHHCDHVNAGGARHAGNLILLCQYHHHEIGDAVSRLEVIQSLQQSEDRSLKFSPVGGTPTSVPGRIVTIHPPQRQTPVTLFFTAPHARYWLARAYEERLIHGDARPQD